MASHALMLLISWPFPAPTKNEEQPNTTSARSIRTSDDSDLRRVPRLTLAGVDTILEDDDARLHGAAAAGGGEALSNERQGRAKDFSAGAMDRRRSRREARGMERVGQADTGGDRCGEGVEARPRAAAAHAGPKRKRARLRPNRDQVQIRDKGKPMRCGAGVYLKMC